MRVLELFSGTGSVGKVCRLKGWEVISLDLKGADINTDIMEWDYRSLPVGHFDIIWASPPCNTFSALNRSNFSKEETLHRINNIGLPILRRTEEIINYFSPTYYFIENPQTGLMKNYVTRPHYDVDYCMYADWGYKKRTRIWTNVIGFQPLLCNKHCGSTIAHPVHGGMIHISNCGNTAQRQLLEEIGYKFKQTQRDRYRVPPNLIEGLFAMCLFPK
jgi:site-specific DNA-cytosine methylase